MTLTEKYIDKIYPDKNKRWESIVESDIKIACKMAAAEARIQLLKELRRFTMIDFKGRIGMQEAELEALRKENNL